MNQRKCSFGLEKQALRNKKQALHNEKQALHNEKQALHNEKQALHNEKRKAPSQNVIKNTGKKERKTVNRFI